jgi:hypothetical protein
VIVALVDPSDLTKRYVIVATLAGTFAAATFRFLRRLVLDEQGARVGARKVAWSDVTHYNYVSVGAGKARMSLGRWALDQTRGDAHRTLQLGKLTIHGRDGQKFVIGNQWRNPREVLDFAFAQLHARLDPLAPGAVAPFGFLRHAIAHPDGQLVYADIERVELKRGRLEILHRGGARWVSEPMWNIRNVLLLLIQLTRLGIAVAVDTNVFLPPSMLSLIVPTGGTAAIPAATLVRGP